MSLDKAMEIADALLAPYLQVGTISATLFKDQNSS